MIYTSAYHVCYSWQKKTFKNFLPPGSPCICHCNYKIHLAQKSLKVISIDNHKYNKFKKNAGMYVIEYVPGVRFTKKVMSDFPHYFQNAH